MSAYPADEFEQPGPDTPVGVHRKPPSRWRPVIPFLVILLMVPILAWGFTSLLQRRDGGEVPVTAAQSAPAETAQSEPKPVEDASTQPSAAPVDPTPEEQPEQPEAPVVNLDMAVLVLNQTDISGYAGQVADAVSAGGFTNVVAENTSDWITQVNTVFYSSDEEQATAAQVAEAAGISEVVLNPDATTAGTITVLLVN